MKINKICPTCNIYFGKPYKYSRKQFEEKIFCSAKCFIPWNLGIKMSKNHCKKLSEAHFGQVAWNKGTKGIMKPNKTSFKSGGRKPKKAYSFGTKEFNPRWNNGKTIGNNGYVYISCPNHPFITKKGYVKRSRLVMEKHIGRYLTKKEVVHHKGINFPVNSVKNRQDDSPENLQLFKNHSEHMKFHHSR